MKLYILRILSSILPISFISASAKAYKSINLDNVDSRRVTLTTNNCDKLIEFEFKEKITSDEWVEAELIHELVQQISNEPLDYCFQLTSMDFLVDTAER